MKLLRRLTIKTWIHLIREWAYKQGCGTCAMHFKATADLLEANLGNWDGAHCKLNKERGPFIEYWTLKKIDTADEVKP